jgi:hypothetical protein
MQFSCLVNIVCCWSRQEDMAYVSGKGSLVLVTPALFCTNSAEG